jgi:excisionase family DNA binding protein
MARLLYPIDEVPDLVPLGKTKLYEEIAAGRLRATRCGRRTFIAATDLADYVELLRQETGPVG